jgi:hypothetical protein
MTAPTAPIDACLTPENSVYWILEQSSIWNTENVVGGADTWTAYYTAPEFEAENNCTDCQFLRIVAPSETLAYVLVYAKKNGESNGSAWILVTGNKGVTWSTYLIRDGITARDYTVTSKNWAKSWSSGQADFYTDLIPHTRVGDDEPGQVYNPWAIARQQIYTCTSLLDLQIRTSDSVTINNFAQSTGDTDEAIWGWINTLLSGENELVAKGWLDEYFGSWTHFDSNPVEKPMPKNAARVNLKFYVDILSYDPQPGGSMVLTTWVFWNKPSPNMPKALAVSPTTTTWLYVGFNDKIMMSEDGGVNWYDFYTPHGAFDICVDPQLAGAIYYWSTDGNLNLLVKQSIGGSEEGKLTSTGLMTETALDDFGRVDRDPSSGRLLAIPNGTTLKMRNNAVNTDLKTGLVNGHGLHVYSGYKMIMVDGSEVWISDDLDAETPSITAKKGTWTEYSNGVQAHRMIAS